MMTVYFRARAAFKVPTEQVLAFSVIRTTAQVKTFHTHSGCCPTRTPHRPPPPKQVTMRLGWLFISPLTACGYMTLCPRCAIAAGPGAPLSPPLLTYLYPFLSLPTGWFGMVLLQRLLLPRGIRWVSRGSGASHLRTGRDQSRTIRWYVIFDKPPFRWSVSGARYVRPRALPPQLRALSRRVLSCSARALRRLWRRDREAAPRETRTRR